MKNSSLLDTLRLLHPNELDRFDKFLRSPFFNEGVYAKDCLALWAALRPFAPKFDAPEIEIPFIFSKTWPDKPFVKGKTEVLMSKLNGLLRQFILNIQERFYSMPANLILAKFFRSRNTPKKAMAFLEKCHQELDNDQPLDFEKRLSLHFLEFEEHKLLSTIAAPAPKRTEKALFWMFSAFLHQAILLVSMRVQASTTKTVTTDLSFLLAKKLPEWMERTNFPADPVLEIQLLLLDISLHPEKYAQPEQFAQVLENVNHKGHQLPKPILRFSYSILRSFCSVQINFGKLEFSHLSNQIYKNSFQNDVLLSDGKMPAMSLLSLTQTAFFAKDFDWAEFILREVADKIADTDDPAAFLRFLKANLAYYRGNFDHALDLLLDNYEDLYNGLMARKLELKTYFETESPLLDAKTDAFRVFVFRKAAQKRWPTNVVTMNKNFISVFQKLCSTNTAAGFQKLQEKIAATRLIAERLWLNERIASALGGKI